MTHIAQLTDLSPATTVNVEEWIPDGPIAAKDAVLFLHGVESHSGWFDGVARMLQRDGIAVYAFDRPGWGSSPGDRGHLPGYAQLVQITDMLIAQIRAKHGRVHLAGMSWGGKLALYLALRRPLSFDTLTLIAPGLFPRDSISFASRIKTTLSILLGSGQAEIPLPIRDEDFTSNTERALYIKNDPIRVHKVSASFCLESLKIDSFIKEHISQLRIPAQLLLAGEDKIVHNAPAVALLHSSGSRALKVHVEPEAAHTLIFEKPEATVALIKEFANKPMPQPKQPRKVLVMGAGAIGSLVGGLLAHGGHDVVLVGRQVHVDAVNNLGLELQLGLGSSIIKQNLRGATTPQEAARMLGNVDLAILSVKNFDTETACRSLANAIGQDTMLLCLQNGVGAEKNIEALLPGRPLFAGAICAYVAFLGAGRVRWESDIGGLAFAPANEKAASLRPALRELLCEAAVEVVLAETPKSVKWSKLMLNLAFNALNALTGKGAGEILSNPKLGTLAICALREGFAAMQAQGVSPVRLPGYNVAALGRVVKLPLPLARKALAYATRNESAGRSSMAQDLARARAATEIAEINGAVVKAGKEAGLATPANERLCALLERAAKDQQFHQAVLADCEALFAN